MKQPWEWNESDLQILIDTGVKESIELDYKRCDSLGKSDGKKTEISKDISALANSAGGTIVYGMIENGHVPTVIDSGYDRSDISKEWLEQIINSNIHRRIDGIIINQIELSTGKVVYAVYVPQSSRAPHQAADNRFYKRFNFESKPMEEYEIRDVSRRAESPNLKLTFNVAVENSVIQFNPIITNESPTPAEYVVINIYIDSKLNLSSLPSGLNQLGEVGFMTVDGGTYPCTQLHMNHSIPAKMPIFEGISFKLFDKPVVIDIPDKGNYFIHWKLMSPKMTQKSGIGYLTWDGISPKVISP
jgi:hypothetical protein